MLICCLFALSGGAFSHAQAPERISATTLTGKLIMGYQGWFACPGDAAKLGWVHWQTGNALTVDLLPDVTELSAADRCPTNLKAADGKTINFFTSQNSDTVEHHFQWMEDYGLDGVALQRFANQLLAQPLTKAVDAVLANVRQAAERHGRVFFLMYDLSGMPVDRLQLVAQDWDRLEREGLTQSPAYLQHRGHPVVGLWGLGFARRPMTPADADKLINALAAVSAAHGGISILAGVPSGWRTGATDASSDKDWQNIWAKVAVISPWTVGRFGDSRGADIYRTSHLEPDLRLAARLGVDYMPVVFPGFSWANLMRARHQLQRAIFNESPRRCGRFYWRQVFDAVSSGAKMLYGAMFDEVDEGTAMFKLVASPADYPPARVFVGLDEDGCHLRNDYYLRLAGAASNLLRDKNPLSPSLPIFK